MHSILLVQGVILGIFQNYASSQHSLSPRRSTQVSLDTGTLSRGRHKGKFFFDQIH